MVKKQQKLTNPIDLKYVQESKPFKFTKQKFTESDLVGLPELRRLLMQLHNDKAKAESEYQSKVQSLLEYKYKASANEIIQYEIDLLRRIIGHESPIDDHPPSDDAVDHALLSLVADAFAERLEKLSS